MNGSFTEERVAQCDAGMREAAGIQDGEADAVGLGRLHAIDELVFGVALEGDQLVPELVGRDLGALLDGGERVGAINVGFALAQQVQVRSIE